MKSTHTFCHSKHDTHQYWQPPQVLKQLKKHTHQTLQTTKHKTMKLFEIIHSTCLIDRWADGQIPTVAIRWKLKIMNKILWEEVGNEQLMWWPEDGGLLIRIKLYKSRPRPDVSEDKTVTTRCVGMWNCLSPHILFPQSRTQQYIDVASEVWSHT